MKTRNWSALAVVMMFIAVLAMVPMRSQAASFDESLTAASVSLPQGADVAAMGGIGTLEEFTSSNPAITSIMKEGVMSSTLNYGSFRFDKTRLETVSGSVTAKVGNAVLQIGAGHGESKMSWINDLDAFRIRENNAFDVQLGGKVKSGMLLTGDELYVGVGYTFTQSLQDGIFITPTPATTFVDEVTMESKSHGATLGLAYKPIKQVTLGGFISRTWTETQATYNGFVDPEVAKSFYDVGHVGFAAKLREGTTIAADYQHVSFSSGSDTKFDQYYAGIEQYVIPEFLAVYLGNANGGFTAGVGMYLEHGGLNFSYGKNTLREVKDTLGGCESFMVSGYINF